jgi:hypothetical protein
MKNSDSIFLALTLNPNWIIDLATNPVSVSLDPEITANKGMMLLIAKTSIQTEITEITILK